MLEPEIPEDDWELISSQWRFSDFWQKSELTKEDIRTILRRVDERFARHRPRFVRKYLEKALTIRYKLCGIPSHGKNAPAWIVEEFKHMFGCLQVPFDRLVRSRKERYSFPNYNFVIRRFCDFLGCTEYAVDFPPLKSAKKREEIVRIWLKLIKFLRWPYINSDGETFGSEYAVNTRGLTEQQQRRRHQRKEAHDGQGAQDESARDARGIAGGATGAATSAGANAYNCGAGLRGQCAHGASTSDGVLSDDPWLSDVLVALAGLDRRINCRFNHDHHHESTATGMDLSCDT